MLNPVNPGGATVASRASDVRLRADKHSKGGASVSDVCGRKAAHDDRDGRVFEFDNTSVVQIPVKNGPISDIDISPDGSRLIVTNYGRNTVSVIDTDTCRVLNTVDDLSEPFAIAMSSWSYQPRVRQHRVHGV